MDISIELEQKISTNSIVSPDDFEYCDIENIHINNNLLHELDTTFLLRIKKYFHKSTNNAGGFKETDNFSKYSYDHIDEEKFINAINDIAGHSDFNLDAARLFYMIDVDKTGVIFWPQFLDLLVLIGKRRVGNESNEWKPILNNNIIIKDLDHCKKESICIVVTIETPFSFCYVVISRNGKVGLYDGKFNFLTDYDVFFIRTGIKRRVRDISITASTYLADNKMLIITASDKTLMIYDASTLCHTPMFFISGIPHIPMCLSYSPSSNLNPKSNLVIGDDHGNLTTLIFKQPKTSLFHKKNQNKMDSYFWIDIQGSLNEPYCKVKVTRRVHLRPVIKIIHVQYNDTIISCSSDSNNSIVIKHTEGIRDPYIFKISRGVTCFHYSKTLNLLATGGVDGHLRIWEPYVCSKPSILFPSQHTKIIDVVIFAHLNITLTFNKNAVLKVWNLINHCCMQTINVKFPAFGILGKPIQFGFQSIYCGAARDKKYNKNITYDESEIEKVLDHDEKRFSNKKKSEMEEEIWTRPEIIITCCDYAAIVPLDNSFAFGKSYSAYHYSRENEFQDNHLPPPLKMHKPKKPSEWSNSICETADITESINNKSAYKPSKKSEHDSQTLSNLLHKIGLPNIMSKNFVDEAGLKRDLNSKLALQRIKQEKMQLSVAQGAPFTALDLYDYTEIKFSLPLPISERMKNRSGLEYFTDPQHMIKYSSCFLMEPPKSNYESSTDQSPVL